MSYEAITAPGQIGSLEVREPHHAVADGEELVRPAGQSDPAIRRLLRGTRQARRRPDQFRGNLRRCARARKPLSTRPLDRREHPRTQTTGRSRESAWVPNGRGDQPWRTQQQHAPDRSATGRAVELPVGDGGRPSDSRADRRRDRGDRRVLPPRRPPRGRGGVRHDHPARSPWLSHHQLPQSRLQPAHRPVRRQRREPLALRDRGLPGRPRRGRCRHAGRPAAVGRGRGGRRLYDRRHDRPREAARRHGHGLRGRIDGHLRIPGAADPAHGHRAGLPAAPGAQDEAVGVDPGLRHGPHRRCRPRREGRLGR